MRKSANTKLENNAKVVFCYISSIFDFYTELEIIFGVGAGFLVKLFVDGVNKKFNLKALSRNIFKVSNSER